MIRARSAGGWATFALLLAPGLASAAWDNVFQLTCCGPWRSSTRVSASPPCCPPPPTCCPQTAYVQRSFMQPVTSFKPVTTWEPVTTNRTSYFWEPVQTMSVSMCVDPCTGCARQIATPQTSYQLRQQCNAVTTWVQRVSFQPVTTYRQSFYYDPVTINPCCPETPTVAAACPPVVAPASCAPVATEQTFPPPGAVVNPAPSATTPPLNYGPENRSMPGSTSEKVNPNTSRPVAPLPPGYRADRLASRSSSSVVGTVVFADQQTAWPGARIQFVNANGSKVIPVTADQSGRFHVTLASGSWKLYIEDAAGRTVHHSDITLAGEDRNFKVVCR